MGTETSSSYQAAVDGCQLEFVGQLLVNPHAHLAHPQQRGTPVGYPQKVLKI